MPRLAKIGFEDGNTSAELIHDIESAQYESAYNAALPQAREEAKLEKYRGDWITDFISENATQEQLNLIHDLLLADQTNVLVDLAIARAFKAIFTQPIRRAPLNMVATAITKHDESVDRIATKIAETWRDK